jgi:hypothetical protein
VLTALTHTDADASPGIKNTIGKAAMTPTTNLFSLICHLLSTARLLPADGPRLKSSMRVEYLEAFVPASAAASLSVKFVLIRREFAARGERV